jgi:hypothetical protein
MYVVYINSTIRECHMAQKRALYAISQGVGLEGNQNILDRFLIAHIKILLIFTFFL